MKVFLRDRAAAATTISGSISAYPAMAEAQTRL